MSRWIGAVLLVLILAGCSTTPRTFQPADPIAPDQVSHQAWDQIVQAHVRDGQVDYPAIQADGMLDGYVRELNHIDPAKLPTRQHQLAFWINAYNAFAVKGILDHYSPMTLWGRYRYFIGRDYHVGGTAINLYDLERQVLIEQFHEPLMHFAIVCASTSCPKLQPWAYRPDQLDRQLAYAARGFINDPSRNRFDRQRKIASLSMIFKWFETDFADAAGSVLVYIARYVDDPELAKELAQPGYRIEYLDYDWSLNGIPPKEEMARAGTS
ncbi:MAG: DUF547 domain-containing protein [Nitrospira sp.]|nr:MAG: DUF547 domain-containing protein [Nitrospira sp.]